MFSSRMIALAYLSISEIFLGYLQRRIPYLEQHCVVSSNAPSKAKKVTHR